MAKKKKTSTKRQDSNVVTGIGENGEPVTVVLVRPWLKGKIDPKVMEAAVKKVREERLRAQAEAQE